MRFTTTWGLMLGLAATACPADDDGDDDGAGTTDGTMTAADDDDSATNPMTMSATAADDDGLTTDGGPSSSDEGSTSGSSGHDTEHHDETVGHDTSAGEDATEDHGTGTTGEPTLCDIIGEGCHDNKTKEGIDCHLTGHEGDEEVCAEIYDMCAEICGLPPA